MSATVVPQQKLTSYLLGAPPWRGMVLQNGYSALAGYVVPQFRYWPLLNSVEIIGAIAPGTPGAIFAALGDPVNGLPATIYGPVAPVSLQQMACATTGGTSAVNMAAIQTDTDGRLTVQQLPTGATAVYFHAWYSIDS